VYAGRPQRIFSGIENPGRVVNVCFVIVFLCSTLLTWRESLVLEGVYLTRQQNSVYNIATELDRQFQQSMGNLLFFRNAMRYALRNPGTSQHLQEMEAAFEAVRGRPFWQIRLGMNLNMPISGVSDDFVHNNHLLRRDPHYISAELDASLAFSYLLQLADTHSPLSRRTFYVSRAGYYVSSLPVDNSGQILTRYTSHISRPDFIEHTRHNNRERGPRWKFSAEPDRAQNNAISATIPLDYDDSWFGVLGMDFTVQAIHDFLISSLLSKGRNGTLLLYDNQFNLIASTAASLSAAPALTPIQLADVAGRMQIQNQGVLRFSHNTIAWSKLTHFDGFLIKTNTINEGFGSEFGRVSAVLGLLWLLFTLMLLGSWIVIRRLVKNMMVLHSSLSWRANFDTLTRLYNRGAFFELAQANIEQCRLMNRPLSVIQMDLDNFKGINDSFGHDAGDRVLFRAAGIISQALRGEDVAGRVGGEEFCAVLPGANLEQAAMIAERIRARIHEENITITDAITLNISASFGVSSSLEDKNGNFEQLQMIADRRLYKAKAQGRNRVISRDESQ